MRHSNFRPSVDHEYRFLASAIRHTDVKESLSEDCFFLALLYHYYTFIMNPPSFIHHYHHKKKRPFSFFVFLIFGVFFFFQTIALFATPVEMTTINPVKVADAGNQGDPNAYGWGAIAYEFWVGKNDVTVEEYAVFLNAVAQKDPLHLYDARMWSDQWPLIQRSGPDAQGNFHYQANKATSRYPIIFINYKNAQRYCNWLENGKPNGTETANTTETGTYNLLSSKTSIAPAKKKATFRLPTNEEYHKITYYKGGSLNGGFYKYPTQTDTLPQSHSIDPNGIHNLNIGLSSQGTDGRNFLQNIGNTIHLPTFPNESYDGSNPHSVGFYGTHDDGGNIAQWTSTTDSSGSFLLVRGADWDYWDHNTNIWNPFYYASSTAFRVQAPNEADEHVGFRVIAIAPEKETQITSTLSLPSTADPSPPPSPSLTPSPTPDSSPSQIPDSSSSSTPDSSASQTPDSSTTLTPPPPPEETLSPKPPSTPSLIALPSPHIVDPIAPADLQPNTEEFLAARAAYVEANNKYHDANDIYITAYGPYKEIQDKFLSAMLTQLQETNQLFSLYQENKRESDDFTQLLSKYEKDRTQLLNFIWYPHLQAITDMQQAALQRDQAEQDYFNQRANYLSASNQANHTNDQYDQNITKYNEDIYQYLSVASQFFKLEAAWDLAVANYQYSHKLMATGEAESNRGMVTIDGVSMSTQTYLTNSINSLQQIQPEYDQIIPQFNKAQEVYNKKLSLIK